MASSLTRRRAVGATIAAAALGIAITLIQLFRVGSSSSTIKHPFSSVRSIPQRDFFRLWHPPWREAQETHDAANSFDRKQPACKRTLLYRFAGSHGFASEYLIFLRVALLAKQFSYELLVDDSHWNYGRWTDYFEPIAIPCAKPALLSDDARVPLSPAADDPPVAYIKLRDGRPSWTLAPHVLWSRRKLDYLDQLVLQLYANTTEIEELHAKETSSNMTALPLSPDDTLPHLYHNIFRVMSKAVTHFWRLNPEMQEFIQPVLSSNNVRHISSTAVIAAHVRLGDKALELHKFSSDSFSKPRQNFQQLYELWYSRAADHVARQLRPREPLVERRSGSARNDNDIEHAPRSVRRPGAGSYLQAASMLLERGFPSKSTGHNQQDSKPILLVMSDDSSGRGLKGFSQHVAAKKMHIVMGLDALAYPSKVLGGEMPDFVTDESKGDAPEQDLGFHENTFNALPVSERTRQTRAFLRDLTAVAKLADGLVFTGSSNVGRLLALLGAQRPAFEKHLASVDVRWFPTARYQ